MRLVPKQVEQSTNKCRYEVATFDDVNTIDMQFNIVSDKDRVKTIKTIERMVRSSLEYKEYIKFLKTYINMTHDSFLKNVEQSQYSKISIEIHHAPLTLYDITMVILFKHEDEYGEIDLLHIAEEVMKVHYQCRVGLLPLAKTIHDLVHDGKIFIPVQMVRGNWIEFFKEYEKYFPEDMKDKLKKIVKFSKDTQDLSMLETKFTYVEVSGFKTLSLIGQEEFLKKATNPPK